MPHSPGPHKYPRTRTPPARPYLSGHVVVAARVPLPLVQPLPTKEGVILRTVTANYVLALPPERAEHRIAGAMRPSSYSTRPTLLT